MEWIELLKLLSDSNAQATMDQKLAAQQKSLEALYEVAKRLDSEIGMMSNSHADAIETLAQGIWISWGVLALVCVVLTAAAAMLYRQLRTVNCRLEALEKANRTDVIQVR